MCRCDCDDDWEPPQFVWRVMSTQSTPPFETICSIDVVAPSKQRALGLIRDLQIWKEGPRIIVENVREADEWEHPYQQSLF